MGRFSGLAPVSWYDVGQFRSLLVHFLRSRGSVTQTREFVESFPGFNKTRRERICKRVSPILQSFIEEWGLVQSLYDEMISAETSHRDRITLSDLGGLGEKSMAENATEFFGAPHQIAYRQGKGLETPGYSCPFVIEVFGARFGSGMTRTIWTGINNTSNYGDPFLRTTLVPLDAATNAGVRGLREFVETFGVGANSPFLIAIHLICPNIRYQDFSKTLIEGGPFSEALVEELSEVLQELMRGEEDAEKKRIATTRESLLKLLPRAVRSLSPSGREYFSLEQLVSAILRLYEPNISTPSEERRLPSTIETQEAIDEYSRKDPNLLANLIRRREVQVYVPSYPGSIAMAASSITSTTLANAWVNKLLVFSDRGMAEVFAANNLLRRFDVAVLLVDQRSQRVHEMLEIVARWEVPLLLAHDASISGCVWHTQLRRFLNEAHIDLMTHDLGLTPNQGKELKLSEETAMVSDEKAKSESENLVMSDWEQRFLLEERRTFRLVAMSPHVLKDWLGGQLDRLGIPEKMEPSDSASLTFAQRVVRRSIERWVIEQLGAALGIDVVVDSVVNSVWARWRVEGLTKQIHFKSDQEKDQSWHQLLESIISTETLKRLAADADDLRHLMRSKAGIT